MTKELPRSHSVLLVLCLLLPLWAGLGGGQALARSPQLSFLDGAVRLTMPADFSEDANSKPQARTFTNSSRKISVKCLATQTPRQVKTDAAFIKSSEELAATLRKNPAFKNVSALQRRVKGTLWYEIVSSQPGNGGTRLTTCLLSTHTRAGAVFMLQVAGFQGDANIARVSKSILESTTVK